MSFQNKFLNFLSEKLDYDYTYLANFFPKPKELLLNILFCFIKLKK